MLTPFKYWVSKQARAELLLNVKQPVHQYGAHGNHPFLHRLQAFSKYQAVNDGVGFVVHSLLLVPFYSWCAPPAGAQLDKPTAQGSSAWLLLEAPPCSTRGHELQMC